VRDVTAAETLSRFKAAVNSSSHPPGPVETWLGETIIHAEDIRRPLGISHGYPVNAVIRVADFYKGSNMLIGAKRRITGLRLQATDTEWSCGEGPDVAGPVLPLVLAMTGRSQAVDNLKGDGVEVLRTRP
jgi:hypothetical protein